MNHRLDNCVLRCPELRDVPSLYAFKNDPEVAALLGGFNAGLTTTDIVEWIEHHHKRNDEIVWIIADKERDGCIGHVGLYHIDYRVRSAEFAIMIGAKDWWGRGLGRSVTRYMVKWGFTELNLNRVSLSLLATNERAHRLYKSIGFVEEGHLREAQFKNNAYVDLILMSILRKEFNYA